MIIPKIFCTISDCAEKFLHTQWLCRKISAQSVIVPKKIMHNQWLCSDCAVIMQWLCSDCAVCAGEILHNQWLCSDYAVLFLHNQSDCAVCAASKFCIITKSDYNHFFFQVKILCKIKFCTCRYFMAVIVQWLCRSPIITFQHFLIVQWLCSKISA